MPDCITKEMAATIKALPPTAGNDARQVRVIASTSAVDRVGDIIEQSGWELAEYRANPTVLFMHDHGKIVGRTVDIGVKNGRLEATIQLLEKGAYSLADLVWTQIQAGALNAVSVGFAPLASTPITGGRRFTKQSLLEVSLVSVPANAQALIIGTTNAKASLSDRVAALKQKTVAEMTPEERAEEIAQLQYEGRLSDIEDLKRADFRARADALRTPAAQTYAERAAEIAALKHGGTIIRKHRPGRRVVGGAK